MCLIVLYLKTKKRSLEENKETISFSNFGSNIVVNGNLTLSNLGEVNISDILGNNSSDNYIQKCI